MSKTSAHCDWNVGERSGRVCIGSHKLWLSTHGPDRKTGEPLTIVIPGLGNSTTGWAAVRRRLTSSTRVLQYERAGYGESGCSLEEPTSTAIAQELDLLLKNANLLPPYIMIAHSWGGILSREFLALRPHDIIGLVFVEANQERTLDVLDWRRLAFSDLLKDVKFFDATGVSHSHKLTSKEWCIYRYTESTEGFQKQAGLEFAEYPKSFPVLLEKSQLHQKPPLLVDHPVCVIRGDNKTDFEKLLAAGLARGNGDEANEVAFREILSTWDEKDRSLQSEIMGLSTNSRYVEAKNTGHNVQLTEPDIIVQGVEWVLSRVQKHK